MGNCKNCKWWELTDRLINEGKCLRITSKTPRFEPAHLVGDDYMLETTLWTRADFGCVQFTKK